MDAVDKRLEEVRWALRDYNNLLAECEHYNVPIASSYFLPVNSSNEDIVMEALENYMYLIDSGIHHLSKFFDYWLSENDNDTS